MLGAKHIPTTTALFLLPLMLFTQSPALRYFSDDDGLPGMTIYEIKQDPRGYLWMATNKGICKFDGREFRKYAFKGLKSNDTPYSFMDQEGTPWFYNLAGEILYVRGDSIKKLELPKIHESSEIYSFFIQNPYLYITWSKLRKPESYKYLLSDLRQYEKLDRNYIFLGLKQGELLAYDLDHMADSVIVYSLEKKKRLIQLPVPDLSKQKFIIETFKYLKHSNGNDLYLAANYLRIFRDDNTLISQLYIPDLIPEKIKYMNFINENELFLSTNKSSYRYLIAQKQLIAFSEFGNYVNTVFEDDYCRRWISTADHGLVLYLNNGAKIFKKDNSVIASDEIATIYIQNDAIFVGHNAGKLSILNLNGKESSKIEFLGSGKIRYIKKWSNSNLIIGSDAGLVDYNIKSLMLKNCPGLNIGSFKGAMVTANGNIYECTSLGIYLCNINSLKNGKCDDYIINRQLGYRTQCIAAFKDKVYAGTYSGLFVQKKENTWERAIVKETFINSLYNYNDSILYMCSDGEGVFFFKDGQIINQLNQENGLPSNNVSCMAHLNSELIAIGTINGVCIYNIHSKNSFYLDKLDGLPGNEITDIKATDSEIWIGTTKGLFVMPINQIQPNIEKPFIELEYVQVLSSKGTSKLADPLNYYENHVRFKLKCKSLLSEKKVKLFYKIRNNDEIWNEANSEVIELIGLSPGSYGVLLKAVNEDGIQSNEIYFPFTIRQAWWKTTWFTFIMLSSIISLSIGLTYWRQNKLRKEESRKRIIQDQINQLREEALQNQMNPHFIFNALNAIQSLLSNNDQLKAMNYLSKFGRLIRMIFEQSRKKRISLENEIEFIRNYLELEELRFGDKISINFIIEQDVIDIAPEMMIPPIIIQPIIENAFKHGLLHKESGGKLIVQFKLIDGQLNCLIEDNGIGRKKASKINQWKNKGHKSTGISTTIERLSILDHGANRIGLQITDLYDKNGLAIGTRALIKL